MVGARTYSLKLLGRPVLFFIKAHLTGFRYRVYVANETNQTLNGVSMVIFSVRSPFQPARGLITFSIVPHMEYCRIILLSKLLLIIVDLVNKHLRKCRKVETC